ncbi:MAG TPA: DPP IV N-terminal domain-containing protein [Gemmatimonadaceae bacterium]|nr:DPP IV N-terminal domain-containing protein [Gemmatimonadaceae bacterium]
MILLAVVGCGGDDSSGPHDGRLQVTVVSEGADVPGDAYRIIVDGDEGPTVPVNGSAEVAGLGPGEHQVTLAGVPLFCTAESALTKTVTVRSDSATQIDYSLTCVRRIMFSEGPSWPAPLHLVRSDGTGGDTTLDLPSVRGANDAVWSPDGASIAFWSELTSAPDSVLPDIFTMDLNSGEVTRLTSNVHSDINPAWSPDGKRIAFARGAYTGRLILTMDADGSNVTALTDSTFFSQEPTWSPDGDRIAYSQINQDEGSPEFGEFQLWIMNSDGSDQTLVADYGDRPVWSPDGSRIAFQSTHDQNAGGRDIYILTLADLSIVRLTHDAGTNDDPAWSPDGSRIVFVSNRDGPSEIYTMHADGSHVVRITDETDYVNSVSWEP